jgi:hypothetical protein
MEVQMSQFLVRGVLGGVAVLTLCLGFTSEAAAKHCRRGCRQTSCCQTAATCNTPAPCTTACAPACAVQQTACCNQAPRRIQQVSCCSGCGGSVQPATYDASPGAPAGGPAGSLENAPPPPKEINGK